MAYMKLLFAGLLAHHSSLLPALVALPGAVPTQWGISRGAPHERAAPGPKRSKKAVETHADKQRRVLGWSSVAGGLSQRACWNLRASLTQQLVVCLCFPAQMDRGEASFCLWLASAAVVESEGIFPTALATLHRTHAPRSEMFFWAAVTGAPGSSAKIHSSDFLCLATLGPSHCH